VHIRASLWYEDNGLEGEAFHHAVAAYDVARAERLIEGRDSLHFRGAVTAILDFAGVAADDGVESPDPRCGRGMPRCC